MTMPVPAHEQPQHPVAGVPSAPPAAAAPPAPTDYTEVGADAYAAAVAAQATAAEPSQPVAAPAAPVEPPGQHLADVQAEVDAELAAPERDYPEGAVAVRLEGEGGRIGVVHILPPDEWPSDANSAMHIGDYESWADGCLALDDFEQVWAPLRPRMKHINAMFEEYRRLTGQAEGKSAQSPRSLRHMARRSKRT
jgi:hypothetical protein